MIDTANTNNLIEIEIEPCIFCGDGSDPVSVDREAYASWTRGELLIQEAFPELSEADRELLQTGSHDFCWINAW